MVSFVIIPNPINFVNKSPLIFSFLFTLHKKSSLFLSTQPILSLHRRGDAVLWGGYGVLWGKLFEKSFPHTPFKNFPKGQFLRLIRFVSFCFPILFRV